MSSQMEDAFNEAMERRASGYEQRIAALDDLVQRAWSLIAGAMSGNPHKPTANSDWMDAAHAWEIDYCMGAGYAAATPDQATACTCGEFCSGCGGRRVATQGEGWSPGIDDPEPRALGDIDTGEGWYQT